MYIFEISELYNDTNFIPIFKYPEGTYQVSINSTLISSSDDSLIEKTKNTDLQRYDIKLNKLQNLNNIGIPNNINPLNYYYMIGKVEFLLYFDFEYNNFYFQPITVAECFMALYIPKSYCELIEKNNTDTFSIFKITCYKLIHTTFKETGEIIKKFSTWLRLNKEEINTDQYELFYWANIQNQEQEFFKEIADTIIELDSYFSYIDISINGFVYDDISNENLKEDDLLNYSIQTATFELTKDKPLKFNFINWSQTSDWKNYNHTQNLLYCNIQGIGNLRVTKQYFKNITGIDLNSQSAGTLTKEQLLQLKINEPNIPPYNRFQYWLKTEKF